MDSKLSWRGFFRIFAIPLLALGLMAAMVHLSDNFITSESPYEGTFQPVRAWTAIWAVLLLLVLNLFPVSGFSGGKIASVLFGSRFANWVGFITIGIFTWLVNQWLIGIILFVIHISHPHLFNSRKIISIPRLQKAAALFLYPIVFVLSFLYLSISAAKVGQLKTPRTDRKDVWVSENGLVDVRGQIHVHSNLSKDSDGTLEEIVKAAKKNIVYWIILTDHIFYLPEGGYYPDELGGVLLIYGNEPDSDESEGGASFRASLKDSEPSLLMYGHIEKFKNREYHKGVRWDAIELVNVHANCFENARDLAAGVFGSPPSIYPSLTIPLYKNLKYWQELAEREQRPIPIFCAPDAHQNVRPLRVLLDPYELMFSLLSTHIWLNEGEELNQANIFSAVKKGRTYIAFDYLGDTTGFQFFAEDQKGGKSFTGDIVENPTSLEISLPKSLMKVKDLYNMRGVEVKFYRNNNLVDDDLFYIGRMNPEPGFWRVEIWRDGYPWIISGQILVK